ncbi:hypothetical protein ILYODFUR_010596 [Ilyodon furcidens]|uniref:Uncharacterized protein n=1 Tax=Ilyodon furcidens TaxID=33524 RepID=A0ABV0TTL2_9TELE
MTSGATFKWYLSPISLTLFSSFSQNNLLTLVAADPPLMDVLHQLSQSTGHHKCFLCRSLSELSRTKFGQEPEHVCPAHALNAFLSHYTNQGHLSPDLCHTDLPCKHLHSQCKSLCKATADS